MMPSTTEVARSCYEGYGLSLMDHQAEAVADAIDYRKADDLNVATGPYRACLYHRTGAGKTITALLMMRQSYLGWLFDEEVALNDPQILVVAPPSTHDSWAKAAKEFLLNIRTVSHSKFRQKDFKISRSTPIIVDEFHLLGGHTSMGWKKLNAIEKHLEAPLIILSATPNYNDIERCYCVQTIINRPSTAGGYINFIYQHCETKQNPYGKEPIVTGLRNFKDAEAYLVNLPRVFFLEDTVIKQVNLIDRPIRVPVDTTDIDVFGLDHNKGVVAGSIMGRMWLHKFAVYLTDIQELRPEVREELDYLLGQTAGKVLIYCESSRIAAAVMDAIDMSYHGSSQLSCGLVTGASGERGRRDVEAFKNGELEFLVCTATIGTGTDGLDKVCDMLIIVDDTPDDAKRRQIMGRILPRGLDADASNKVFYRFQVSNS